MAETLPTAAATTTTNCNDSDKTKVMLGDDAGGSLEQEQGSQEPGVDGEQKEPEEALETHEVLELNKFTERKEWIEEKIRLLEGMPPIEVFAGVETLLTLSEEIPPDLPTRAQLDCWLEEHDRTEKETEIFDAEDMSKLKKVTKAATQRNLSPEDTDLIELTLTTLLALDRLLHLLRDRSETLDLLGLRLTWEEQRVASWRDRRSLLEDLEAFLTTRARWSLATYELPPSVTPTSSPAIRFGSSSPSPSPRPSPSPERRRDSAASLASISSDTSIATTGPSSAFSRSTRYKLAELLSHDAALFSARLTALNHGKVMPAGKTLDSLIDASRKPVPDEILDEQDRLENKGIKEIETIGKFAMTVVMQWKRADEHYNDTKKDQAAAEALIIELNNAKLQHPTPRHDTAFMPRAQALTKRLAVKGDPALPRSSFPRPLHPLFPEQGASNDAIATILSTELAEAVRLARQAETSAMDYRAGLEAVNRAERLRAQMQGIGNQLEKLTGKLVKGVHDENGHGDGSPPDFERESCLDPMRHATFLALLPSVVLELDQADRAAERALREAKVAALRLKDLPGVNMMLREMASTIERLEARRIQTKCVKDEALSKARRLREARQVWGVLDAILRAVEEARKEAVIGMDSQRWKVRKTHEPLTPDSDSPRQDHVHLPVTLTPSTLLQRLDALEQRLTAEFKVPITTLSPTLEAPLHKHLQSSSGSLSKYIDDVRDMARLWDGILKQAGHMLGVQRDAKDLEGKIDTLQASIDDTRQDVLNTHRTIEIATALEADFKSQAVALQDFVRAFTDSLVARVPLVARADGSRGTHPPSNSLTNFTSSDDLHLDNLKERRALTLPFDLPQLDSGVRAEANTLALRLAGGMQSVGKRLNYLRLSRLAKVVDGELEGLARDLSSSEQTLSHMQTSFEAIGQRSKLMGLDASLSEALVAMRDELDRFEQDHRMLVARSMSPVRQALTALCAVPGAHDSPIHGMVVTPRVKAVDEVSRRVDTINDGASKLRTDIMEAEKEERDRVRVERERLEAEEKARQEQERVEAEERARQEEQWRLAEARARLESEHRAAAEMTRSEATRLERERLDAEEKARIEQQRIEEAHANTERTRAEAERAQQEREVAKRTTEEQSRAAAVRKARPPDQDVFGLRLTPSVSSTPRLRDMADLQSHVLLLRNRLRSLSLSSLVRPSSAVHDSHAAAALPTSHELFDVQHKFSAMVSETAALPVTVAEDAAIDSELKSLRLELDAASALIQRLIQLSHFTDKVALCDHALSDLLEHADTYPAAPLSHQLASRHVSDSRLPCEEQLANRLTFTQGVMSDMSQLGTALADDLRVVGERSRLQQTWSELTEMCNDRLNGTCSRPTSSVSSTRRGSIITTGSGSPSQRNPKPSLNGNGQHRTRPSGGSSRRTISNAHDPISRPSTHMSNRSLSGPSGFSSLFNTTFASRQRTTSLASIQSATATPAKRAVTPATRPRTASKRPGSPTFSETSGNSLASTPSKSTWSRAPRQSFGMLPRNFEILDRTPKRRAYVANPKSKLDVAVGNVVNNFRVPVTIQAAGDDWKDQSGKYWIGDIEPKLCFCRILRSQTVMVRVGGGWCELSKFLKGHFAELLAELPPSPPRKEERWISSTTLLEASETLTSTPLGRGLTTPEPKGSGHLPSFQLSTPNGTSPQSLKTSSPSDGSPGLTPFKFMRRAEPGIRSVTPSPSKSARMKPVTPVVTPSRTNIWRP